MLCFLFQPSTKFDPVLMHPRYGFIMSLVALRNINQGEEITVSYNYNVENAPQWYRSQHNGLIMAFFFQKYIDVCLT